MKCRKPFALVTHLRVGCLLLCSLVAGSALAAGSNYIVETKPGTPITPLASKYQFSITKSAGTSTATFYAVNTLTPLPATSLTELSEEPGVLAVETNSEVDSTEASSSSKAQQTPQSLGNLLSTRATVPYYGASVLTTYVNQPGMQMIELIAAHAAFGAGTGVIAIIDTGVDLQHPALQGALVPGYDFTRDRSDTVSELLDLPAAVAAALAQSTVELLDAKQYLVALQQSTVEILDQSTVELLDGGGLPSAFGHGTMVAGLIHLVAPGAKIMPLKAFHADGSANIFDIANAIRFAADNGAGVISMSFSYDAASPDMQAAIAYAQSKHVICVASSGNAGQRTSTYPADYPHVIGVGSVNLSDSRSTFSNYGSSARTSAPGEALVTIFPGGNYAAVWGTSFSSALVAGGINLMLRINPHLASDDLGDVLDSGVQIDQGMGDARLDLLKSLIYLLLHGGN